MTREHAKKILTHLRNGKSDLMLMDALDMAISALSAEGEYINKKDVIEEINNLTPYCDGNAEFYERVKCEEIIEKLSDLPTYSFPEREKGEWIEKRNKATGHIESVCSVCGAEESYPYNLFCPNCGADMRGVTK